MTIVSLGFGLGRQIWASAAAALATRPTDKINNEVVMGSERIRIYSLLFTILGGAIALAKLSLKIFLCHVVRIIPALLNRLSRLRDEVTDCLS